MGHHTFAPVAVSSCEGADLGDSPFMAARPMAVPTAVIVILCSVFVLLLGTLLTVNDLIHLHQHPHHQHH